MLNGIGEPGLALLDVMIRTRRARSKASKDDKTK